MISFQRSRKKFSVAGGMVLALLPAGIVAAPAAAQEDAVPATARAEAEQSRMGDIVVTARRREERVLDVPIAIKAYGAEELQRYATQSYSGLAAQTPQLSIGRAGGGVGMVVALRGISAGTSSAALDQPVSVNIDGLQISQATLLKVGLYDLERVEILKGPQALFFGKNSLAGIISITTADPGASTEAMVRTGYDIYSRNKFIEAMVSVPLSERLGVRLVGYADDHEGWYINRAVDPISRRFPNGNTYFLRGTIKYDSPGVFSNTFKASYGRLEETVLNSQAVFCPLGQTQHHGIPDCKLDRYANITKISDEVRMRTLEMSGGGPITEQRVIALANTAEIQAADTMAITSVSTYYDGKDFNFQSFGWGNLGTDEILGANRTSVEQFTQELRLSSSFDGPINFTAGAYYQDFKLTYTAVAAVSGRRTGSPNFFGFFQRPLFEQKTTAYSFFGQFDYAITPTLDLTAGGRWSHEKKKVRAFNLGTDFIPRITSPIVLPVPEKTWDNFSPEVTLRWKPISDLMAYATYRKGFTSGGYNLIPAGNLTPFDQQTVSGGEVGAKGLVLDRQLQFDLAIFHYKYKGLQVSAFDPATLGFRVINAAGAKSYGAELSVNYQPDPIPGLTLRGTIAWTHARYTDYPTAQCYAGQTVALGCDRVFVAGPGGVINPANPTGPTGRFTAQDLSGKRLYRTPDWAGIFGGTYEMPIGNDMVLSTSADVNYKGTYNAFSLLPSSARQKESWQINANIRLRAEDDGWEIAAIGRNLTKSLRATDASDLAFTGFGTGTNGPAQLGDLAGYAPEPPTLIVQLTLRDSLLRR